MHTFPLAPPSSIYKLNFELQLELLTTTTEKEKKSLGFAIEGLRSAVETDCYSPINYIIAEVGIYTIYISVYHSYIVKVSIGILIYVKGESHKKNATFFFVCTFILQREKYKNLFLKSSKLIRANEKNVVLFFLRFPLHNIYENPRPLAM